MTVSIERCPRCGAYLPVRGLTHALCPGCLMASALEDHDVSETLEPEDYSFGIPYQIVTLMARDAQGVTYLARPAGAAGHVALKILGPRDDAGAILDRARVWTTRLAQVRHPHIARLLDAGPAAEACVYIAAEYIAGPALAVPACRERLTRADRVAVLAQLADALETLGALGIAHLRLDASHVKIAARDGVHATLIGLGTGLIVDGLLPQPERDIEALAVIARDLEGGA
jgi:serine/threonine-protein kinase